MSGRTLTVQVNIDDRGWEDRDQVETIDQGLEVIRGFNKSRAWVRDHNKNADITGQTPTELPRVLVQIVWTGTENAVVEPFWLD